MLSLAGEEVDFDKLIQADAYVEFETHLAVLEQLRENYRQLLDEKGLTDKAFLPKVYSVNSGFIERYKKIEIYLEGYLSRFELQLLALHDQPLQQ